MSIVLPQLSGAKVLDLFAGSGALGLEALSRGAAQTTFVESSPKVLRTLKQNIDALDAGDASRVVRGDAMKFAAALSADEYDVAFADPPYGSGQAARLATLWLVRPFAALLGVEHAAGEQMPDGGDTRRYGDSAITLYKST
jgi:16S rRNA (guanine966-N2)-methyltransferase